CDNVVFIPSGANFDGQRNFHRCADGAQKLFQVHEVAQKSGSAALHYFFYWTAEIYIRVIETEIFNQRRRGRHHIWIGAKNLTGDGMLVLIKIKIAKSARGLARESFGASKFGHDQTASA